MGNDKEDLTVDHDGGSGKSGASHKRGTHGSISKVVQTCHNCGMEGVCRRRTFSEQAWTVLLLWNEINPEAVDQMICTHCYEEMRDILIDRSDEIEASMSQKEEVRKIRARLNQVAS